MITLWFLLLQKTCTSNRTTIDIEPNARCVNYERRNVCCRLNYFRCGENIRSKKPSQETWTTLLHRKLGKIEIIWIVREIVLENLYVPSASDTCWCLLFWLHSIPDRHICGHNALLLILHHLFYQIRQDQRQIAYNASEQWNIWFNWEQQIVIRL